MPLNYIDCPTCGEKHSFDIETTEIYDCGCTVIGRRYCPSNDPKDRVFNQNDFDDDGLVDSAISLTCYLQENDIVKAPIVKVGNPCFGKQFAGCLIVQTQEPTRGIPLFWEDCIVLVEKIKPDPKKDQDQDQKENW